MPIPAETQMAQQQGVAPVDYVPGPSGQPIPHYMNASPGISGALLDMIRALSQALAPKSVTQAKARTNIQAGQQESGSPATTDLGNQF